MKSLIIVIVLSLIAGLYRTFIKKDKNWHKLSESERYDLERTTKSGVELAEEAERRKRKKRRRRKKRRK